ncbi:MAG TPA: protein kinase [Bryobacteraceae bacterium]|nr:protein kinase [Bryobacteraceae bacterium]
MSLAPSTRLGPYEILSAIGAGGMGEVYRARDTRLDRTVAIKVLPEHLSSNPQLRERFEREAKAISSLSHPHICPLYDVGQQDGVDFLVMEHLEGETLAHRLKKGPLAAEQVLQYAIQITDALDTAHRHGVIHRDLKPGNIMLTKTGAKLLDFGLAKVRAAEAAAGMTALPTQTTPLTGEGTILGTLQYMAPEQLEGAEADARTDIFALGTVIYEMATGQKAFAGKSQASVTSAIMTVEPPLISTLQPLAPAPLDHVVQTCLAKDPDARWQTAHDVLIELKWIAGAGSQAGILAPVAARRKSREVLAWALVIILALGAVGLAVIHFRQKPLEVHPVRFQVQTPEKVTFGWNDTPVVSPDGQRFVFTGTNANGNSQLWMRALDSPAIQPLAGTEGAALPFWSPDSRFIAFFSEGKLKKIEASGGPAEVLCNASGFPTGGSWSSDGVILFHSNGHLVRVSPSGGEATPVRALDSTRPEPGFATWPQFLPDGRHFLYVVHSNDAGKGGIYLGALDSKETRLLIPSESNAIYAPRGFLIYGRQNTLLAQPFDLKELRLAGEPVSIAEQVGAMTFLPGLMFSVSQNGVAVYRSAESAVVQLAWYNREGKRLAAIGEPGLYGIIVLSPEEKRLAMERLDPQLRTNDLWTLELASGILSRQTFHPTNDTDPVWSPDGRELVFTSDAKGQDDLYRKAVGGRDEEPLFESGEQKYPKSWPKDGKSIVFINSDGKTFYQLSLTGERKPVILSKSEFTRDNPHVSPDGRWIAYNSLESGRWEVYVAAFPAFNEKRQVSVSGGCQPMWRKDGKELFYRTLEGKMMVVELKGGSTLQTGVPLLLFQTPARVNPIQSEYCVTGDGKRFIFREPVGESGTPITVVLNWNAGLKR